MRSHGHVHALLVCAALFALIPTLALAAGQSGERADAPMLAIPTAPLAINVNLGGEPTTLDPSLANDSTSTMAIEQLFIGLVDLDDTCPGYLPHPCLPLTEGGRHATRR